LPVGTALLGITVGTNPTPLWALSKKPYLAQQMVYCLALPWQYHGQWNSAAGATTVGIVVDTTVGVDVDKEVSGINTALQIIQARSTIC
jgi:predicted dinucleotide-binding enzyme